jgi:Ser/Thr protein kinase RdoA (MazF antagonist)
VTEVPPFVLQAADAFGLDQAGLRSLGGTAGSSWSAATAVLRVGLTAVLDAELAAAGAAAAVLPVPTVLGRADFAGRSALLLERLPGRPAAELAVTTPARARAAGLACGRVHDVLAGVPAPAGLRPVPGAPSSATAGPARLLHLDLHPLNVLVDDDGAVTGVLDWANTAAGDPVLDRARTWAIMALDPAARAAQTWPGWAEFAEGWFEAGRLDDLPAAARAWACRFMLADLARRYSPAELAHVQRTLDELT